MSNGDSLQVIGANSPDYCGDRGISALYLVCLEDGRAQMLDDGFTGTYEGVPPCSGDAFYDETFTVAV